MGHTGHSTCFHTWNGDNTCFCTERSWQQSPQQTAQSPALCSWAVLTPNSPHDPSVNGASYQHDQFPVANVFLVHCPGLSQGLAPISSCWALVTGNTTAYMRSKSPQDQFNLENKDKTHPSKCYNSNKKCCHHKFIHAILPLSFHFSGSWNTF